MRENDDNKTETVYSDFLIDRLAKLKEEEARVKSKRRIYFSAVSAGSLSTSAVAISYIMFDRLSYSSEVSISLMVALTGVLLAIFGVFFRQRDIEIENLKREIYHLDSGKMRLLREWIAFESLSRKIVISGSRANEQLTLPKIIDFLSDQKLVGEIDKSILIASLKSRNEIVHNGESSLSPSEEYLLQERLSHINETLFSRLRENSNG